MQARQKELPDENAFQVFLYLEWMFHDKSTEMIQIHNWIIQGVVLNQLLTRLCGTFPGPTSLTSWRLSPKPKDANKVNLAIKSSSTAFKYFHRQTNKYLMMKIPNKRKGNPCDRIPFSRMLKLHIGPGNGPTQALNRSIPTATTWKNAIYEKVKLWNCFKRNANEKELQ